MLLLFVKFAEDVLECIDQRPYVCAVAVCVEEFRLHLLSRRPGASSSICLESLAAQQQGGMTGGGLRTYHVDQSLLCTFRA